MVTICIPLYNGANFLHKCLESAINQTHQDLEILVVDDFSTDESVFIVKRFIEKDNRIRLIQNKENLGLVGNWNKAIQESTGKWIKMLFQDDILYPNCVEKMLSSCVNENKSVAICSRNFIINENISVSKKTFYNRKEIKIEHYFPIPQFVSPTEFSKTFTKDKLFFNFLGEPIALFIEKELFNKYGLYDEDLVHLVDYEFLLRVIFNEGAYFIPEPLYDFRVHSGSESNKNHFSENNIKIFKFEYLEPLLLYNKYLTNKFFSSLRNKVGARLIFNDALFYYHHKEINKQSKDSIEIKELLHKKFKKYPSFKLISIAANIVTVINNLKKAFLKLKK